MAEAGAWPATVQSQKESHTTEQLSNDDLGSRRKHGTFMKKETGRSSYFDGLIFRG